jgi:hypothetical protein
VGARDDALLNRRSARARDTIRRCL